MTRLRFVEVGLTPAQLLMVNDALARYEADDHDPTMEPRYIQGVMDRTRQSVWRAMNEAGVA